MAEIIECVRKYVDGILHSLQIWAIINQVLMCRFLSYGIWLTSQTIKSADIRELVANFWQVNRSQNKILSFQLSFQLLKFVLRCI